MKPSGWKLSGVILLGILFHCTYMYSIIDIYFRSPIVRTTENFNLESVLKEVSPNLSEAPKKPPADRVVFIVSDGLRADAFFEIHNNKSSAPYLRSIVEGVGSWGISHTRMPTESRPCHVAMFAGFYEDVSAVTTGWQENVVQFDSVFNQSNYVLQIGSPDVVKMFRSDHVESLYYEPELEDFASADPSKLDGWVFERVGSIFAKQNASDEYEPIRQKLRNQKDRVVIFLHLLGADLAGHAYKPATQAYRETLNYVDQGVQMLEKQIKDFYNDDGRTAFIFTADHGMSNRGSHGDGDPDCTRTPLLCWGSGIRRGDEPIGKKVIDSQSNNDRQAYDKEGDMMKKQWRLDIDQRRDIEQADMCALLSCLLGTPIPGNNIGTVPVGHIDEDDFNLALHLFANARQMLQQFQTKELVKKTNTSPRFFVPYGAPLSIGHEHLVLDGIKNHIRNRQYQKAQLASLDLIEKAKQGFDYYQKYDWTFLMSVVTLGYIGWMLYLMCFILSHYTTVKQEKLNKMTSTFIDVFTVIAGCALTAYLYANFAAETFYAYCFFPLVFYNQIFKQSSLLKNFLKNVSFTSLSVTVLLCLIGLEVMVYGYYRRQIFSVCFLLVGIAPALIVDMTFQSRFGWLVACIFASLFTLSDVSLQSNSLWVVVGGAWIVLKQLIWNNYTESKRSKSQYVLFYVQLFLIGASSFIVYSTDASLAMKTGLPLFNQYASILITLTSALLPLLSSNHYKVRIQSVFMGFAAPMILLSVKYEVLFYSSLEMFVYNWIKREVKARESSSGVGERAVQHQDVTSAMFYIFLFNVGFFGTGNLATIASFELGSVYRFVTVFAPFVMTALLLFKIIIPLISVTAAYGTLLRVTRAPQYGGFFLVLALLNVMTINFFFLVSTEGSWLDIGNGISRFGIGNAMIIVLLVLLGVSQVYTHNVEKTDTSNNVKKIKRT